MHKIVASVGAINQALQNSKLHFQNANKPISDLKEILQIYKGNFNELWASVIADTERMKIGKPILPRMRKAPRTFNHCSQGHIFTAQEEYYKHQYMELIDTAIAILFKKAGLTQKRGSFSQKLKNR